MNALFQPFHGDGAGQGPVQDPEGGERRDGRRLPRRAGRDLERTLFEIRLTLAGQRNDLFAGNYTLAEDMSYSDVIAALTKPPSQRTIAVTIPEGYSREQIAKISDGAGLEGDYEKALEALEGLDPAEYGAEATPKPRGLPVPGDLRAEAEGDRRGPRRRAARRVRAEFKKVDLSYAKSKNLTAYDVLTIASMIEREVRSPRSASWSRR